MKFLDLFKSKRKRELHDSDFGRKDGWYVELNSIRIAELINPNHHEMFWVYYDLIILDSDLTCEIQNEDFWLNDSLRFFSKSLEEYANMKPLIVVDGKKLNVRALAI